MLLRTKENSKTNVVIDTTHPIGMFKRYLRSYTPDEWSRFTVWPSVNLDNRRILSRLSDRPNQSVYLLGGNPQYASFPRRVPVYETFLQCSGFRKRRPKTTIGVQIIIYIYISISSRIFSELFHGDTSTQRSAKPVKLPVIGASESIAANGTKKKP